MKCPSCHGDKDFRGRKIRGDRIKRGFTLLEEAKRRKLDVLTLSEMERGVIDPLPKGKSK